MELESKREMIVKQLEERQTTSSKQADEFDARHKELGKVLDQLKSGRVTVRLNSLFCHFCQNLCNDREHVVCKHLSLSWCRSWY